MRVVYTISFERKIPPINKNKKPGNLPGFSCVWIIARLDLLHVAFDLLLNILFIAVTDYDHALEGTFGFLNR